MASFLHQVQVAMSGQPTHAAPTSSTDPIDHIFDTNNALQEPCRRPETFASQVIDKVDPTTRTRDELYEDMQELFKDEAEASEAFDELHELPDLNELDDFRELDELLKPINTINEERAEFISNSSDVECLLPAKPEEKDIKIASPCPVQVSNQRAQTPHRQTQAARRPLQSQHRPVRQTQVPLQTTQVPVQATPRPVRATPLPVRAAPRPVRATPRPVQATRRLQQATNLPAQGSRRQPTPPCPPVRVSGHRPPRAPCRPVQATNRGPPQAARRPVQASHQSPPKVPHQPVQVLHRRPPKAPTRPVRASQHPSPSASHARASQRPVQASQYAAPPAPSTQAAHLAMQGTIRVGETTAAQILEYLKQPPVMSVSSPDTNASMMTGGHLASNPRALHHAPPSVVSPSNLSATFTVGGHPIPSSGGLHQVSHVAAAPNNMSAPVAARGHLTPSSRVMQPPQNRIPRNVNASAVRVDPRVRIPRNPGYAHVNHATMGARLQPQMVQNPNVPVVTPMGQVSRQEVPYSQGSGMNQSPMRGQSGLKRKMRQEQPRVVRQRTPGPNGAIYIPGSAPQVVPQTPVYAIPVQQNPYPVTRENLIFAPGQGNPMQPAYGNNGGAPTLTRVQGQPVQHKAQVANNTQMRPPRPRRKTGQPPAVPSAVPSAVPPVAPPATPTTAPTTAPRTAPRTASPSAAQTPSGPSKPAKPAKAVKPAKPAKAATASKPPRAPRGGKAAQNAAKRKAEAPADGSERPKKRTRTRIEDLDPAAVHTCDYEGCDKKFAKKYNLKIHQRRHTGDLPFTCEYEGCEKRFMWLSSYSRHERVHKPKEKGGRKKREPKKETPQDVDITPAEESDIAIADNYSVFSVGRLQHLVENEKSEQVTAACSLTALDAKPCQNLVPASKNAQSQRQDYLCGARAEEFYQYLTTPYQVAEPQMQTFCEVLTDATDPDRYMQDPTAFVNL